MADHNCPYRETLSRLKAYCEIRSQEGTMRGEFLEHEDSRRQAAFDANSYYLVSCYIRKAITDADKLQEAQETKEE